MHEYFIVQNIIKTIEEIIKDYPGKKIVKAIFLIGKFSGIEIDILKNALEFFKKETPLEKAEIVFELEDLKIKCLNCGAENIKEKWNLMCPNCGSMNTEVISGEELILKTLELV